MKKSELVEHVCSIEGLKPKQCSRIISHIFDHIAQSLGKGESVKIKYFGTFMVKSCAGHKGVNPRTGEQIEIPEKNRVIIKASKVLKDILN